MKNIDYYRNFCKKEINIPIFSRDWWLDSVCGYNKWDVALVRQDREIIASMPYCKIEKGIFNIILMPQLTQNMGVYIKYPEGQRYEKRLSFEKDILNSLLGQLPKFDYFSQNFHYNFTNWLPFYWNGFEQTTKYTYVIENLINLNDVFENFNHAKRKNIKKAKDIVEVKFDLSSREFYENHKMTLLKQGSKISYEYSLFKNIYDSSYKNNAGRTIYAVDSNSNIHAALFVVWDSNSAYDLISTIDPDFRKYGAASLLIRNIIEYVSTKTNAFDFEGSMIENVENSFRQFGAIQKPYFNISKTNSKLLKIKNLVKEIIK